MRHHVQMTSGWEYDALTKRGRAGHHFRAGRRNEVKRRYRRRERKALKESVLGQEYAEIEAAAARSSTAGVKSWQ